MEGLYKSKGKFGLASKERRKECNRLNSQAKRADVIASRRKMPMGALGVARETKGSPIIKTKTRENSMKPTNRLQRLKEWQQAREEIKARSNAQKNKPVFAVRRMDKSQAQESFVAKLDTSLLLQKSFSTKKAILCMSPKPARPTPASRVTRSGIPTRTLLPPSTHMSSTGKKMKDSSSSNQKHAVKRTKPAMESAKKATKVDPKPSRQAVATRHSLRLALKQTSASTTKQVAPAASTCSLKSVNTTKKEGNPKTSVKKVVHARGENTPKKSVQISTRRNKKTPPVSQHSVSKRMPPVVSQHNVSKKTLPVTRHNVSKKMPPVIQRNVSKKMPQRNVSKKTPPVTQRNVSAPEEPSPEPVLDNSGIPHSGNSAESKVPPAVPTTPIKNYQPVHPSPLLSCRSASKQPDPAWIPGSTTLDFNSNPDFESVFGAKFSPFQFTAGSDANNNVSFQFTFSMDPVPAQQSSQLSSDTNLECVSDYCDNENAPAGMLEDLITFSDTSDCSISVSDGAERLGNTPKRRSTRNSGSKRRKSCVNSDGDKAMVENTCDAPESSNSSSEDKLGGKTQLKIGSTPRSTKKRRGSIRRCKTRDTSSSDSPDASPLIEVALNTPSKVQSLAKSSQKTRSSSRRLRLSVSVERMGGDVVKNLEEEYDKENNGVDNNAHLAIAYFRQLHSDACDKLEQLCGVWEGKSTIMERKGNTPNLEEVLGQIRTTSCQGRLLMRKKLKQYIGLVNMAESNSGERKTTHQDLQGFWDMVYFQVDGLYRNFQELEDMERNGWQACPPSPKKPKLQKRKAKKGVVKCAPNENSEASQRLQAARKKREAERAKLRELKVQNAAASKENQNQLPGNDMLKCTLLD